MPRKLLEFLAVLLVLTVPLGSAQAIDSNKLREDIIAGLTHLGGPSAASPVTFDDVRVRPIDKGYRVDVTGLKGKDSDRGQWADVGDVAFSVEETKPGYYHVFDLAVPSSVPIYGGDGKRIALLAYALQRFDGVWVGALSNFLELDLLVTDVRFGLADGSFVLKLERLGGISRAQQGSNGRTDQQAKGRATGLHAEAPGDFALDIAEVSGETSMTGMDLEAYAQLTREYEALAGREGGASEADLAALIQRMSALNVLPGGFAERFSVSDVRATDAAGQSQFRLDHGEMDFAGSGLDQALAELRFGMKHENLDLGENARAQAGPLAALVPRNHSLVASVERLPADRLWHALLRTLAFAASQGGLEGQASGPMNQMLMFMFLGEALPALTEAGTKIKLPHFMIESDAAKLTADGAFDVNPAAPQGFTGAMQVAITGLDRVIALLEEEVKAGNQDAIAGLGMANWLKGLGRRETDGQSQAVDRYSLQLTADGRTLLNGQPFLAPPPPQE